MSHNGSYYCSYYCSPNHVNIFQYSNYEFVRQIVKYTFDFTEKETNCLILAGSVRFSVPFIKLTTLLKNTNFHSKFSTIALPIIQRPLAVKRSERLKTKVKQVMVVVHKQDKITRSSTVKRKKQPEVVCRGGR